ncbi:hypothetical protein M501DRAFT_1015596 [Patellaria atrata CBS 101060]|uniref:UBC core domain-containing protein n=1 Tax=Patellaria atrata CBS 101060 TaxID=1346257 RepID=A0A9P4SCV3_9PEZI|nr:hypothetical protein M501DRAFT_1015596 [Patellaria atrata CBS 101060]
MVLKDFILPDEAIVICVNTSGGMREQIGKLWVEPGSSGIQQPGCAVTEMIRLTEVKDVFRNLVARILTLILVDFQDKLEGVSSVGQTAIWSALHKANSRLANFKQTFPTAKRRIILLTDGKDNNSTVSPSTMCSIPYASDVVVDVVIIATDKANDLFKFAKHTRGYAFCPQTRSALFQVFLLEIVIDVRIRPDVQKEPIYNFETSIPKIANMQDPYNFPRCRPHTHENDEFVLLKDAKQFFSNVTRGTSQTQRKRFARRSTSTISSNNPHNVVPSTQSSTTATHVSVGGPDRITLNKVNLMIQNEHPTTDIYVCERNMGFWEIAMQEPPYGPYSKGVFLLYIHIDEDFPRKSPTARFITLILHSNVTKHR